MNVGLSSANASGATLSADMAMARCAGSLPSNHTRSSTTSRAPSAASRTVFLEMCAAGEVRRVIAKTDHGFRSAVANHLHAIWPVERSGGIGMGVFCDAIGCGCRRREQHVVAQRAGRVRSIVAGLAAFGESDEARAAVRHEDCNDA